MIEKKRFSKNIKCMNDRHFIFLTEFLRIVKILSHISVRSREGLVLQIFVSEAFVQQSLTQ